MTQEMPPFIVCFMEVTIDGKKNVIPITANSTLKDVINKIQEYVTKQCRVITSLTLDNENLTKKLVVLASILVNFGDAFAKKDVTLMGDIAEYKLKPLINDYYELVEKLMQIISKQVKVK